MSDKNIFSISIRSLTSANYFMDVQIARNKQELESYTDKAKSIKFHEDDKFYTISVIYKNTTRVAKYLVNSVCYNIHYI